MCTAFRLNWCVLVCVMAAFLTSTLGELTRTCSSDSIEKRGRHLCGPQLAETLSLVCSSSGYNVQKRSTGSAANGWEVEPAHSGRSPFVDKHIAMSVLHSRGKRGIVCECCKHKCSFMELKEYCKHPGKRSFLAATPPKSSPDQVTSNSIDDATWGLDEAALRLASMDDGDSPSTRTDLDSRADSHIGRLVRLLLDKSSIDDSTN